MSCCNPSGNEQHRTPEPSPSCAARLPVAPQSSPHEPLCVSAPRVQKEQMPFADTGIAYHS